MKNNIKKVQKKQENHDFLLILCEAFRRDGVLKISVFSTWEPRGAPGRPKTEKDHQNEPQMPPKYSQNVSQVTPKWFQNGPEAKENPLQTKRAQIHKK